MKNYQLITFVSIILTIYSLVNLYIFFKGYGIFPGSQGYKLYYTIIFLILALSFIAGKILEVRHSSVFSDILNITGGFWLGFMLYGFTFLLLSDITGIILRIPGIINAGNLPEFRKWSFLAMAAISVLLIAGGFVNALIPVVKEYDVTIGKDAGNTDSLRIAAVSDIHLGSVIRRRSLVKLSRMIEEMKPDLVLLLGDIVDGELGPVLRSDLLQYFKAPQSKNGLYAITGNHEYIGGAGRTIPYIESKGIRILKDETVVLPGGIQLVGRLDRDSFRFNGTERKPLGELLNDIDFSKPVILLDHQPVHLDESEKHGIDLQLSGHTHNGQLWPLNYITGAVYELSNGYERKGNTQIIVSSGYGLWGPRIRLGSRSEVLLINIKFTGNKNVL